jgi:hypothetical protein
MRNSKPLGERYGLLATVEREHNSPSQRTETNEERPKARLWGVWWKAVGGFGLIVLGFVVAYYLRRESNSVSG